MIFLALFIRLFDARTRFNDEAENCTEERKRRET
jgi:hypothetical protein